MITTQIITHSVTTHCNHHHLPLTIQSVFLFEHEDLYGVLCIWTLGQAGNDCIHQLSAVGW